MFRLRRLPEDDTIYLLKIIVVPSGIDPLWRTSFSRGGFLL